MNMNEPFFRILLAASFIVFVGIWLRSFFLSGVKREAFYTSAEGLIVGSLMRLFLTLGIAGIVGCLVHPNWMAWSALLLPRWIRLMGLPVFILGICLLIWALNSLKRSFSATLVIKEGHSLVTAGPYRCLQHPMYTSFIMIWSSFFLLSANWFIGLTAMAAYSVIVFFRTPREERMMFDKYGEEYSFYRTHTRRYIPKLACLMTIKKKK